MNFENYSSSARVKAGVGKNPSGLGKAAALPATVRRKQRIQRLPIAATASRIALQPTATAFCRKH